MYPKVKTVRRGGGSYEDPELVEGRREGARGRQHVVANPGRPHGLTARGKPGRVAARLAPPRHPPPGPPPPLGARPLRAADGSGVDLDLTAVRFAGSSPGSGLVEKGWAADRTIARQVKTLQDTVPAGVALYFRPHKGAANELPAFAAAIEALAAALPPGLVVVADSGLGYLENLGAADARSVKFVVPLRASTGWPARVDAGIPGGPAALAVLAHVSSPENDPPAAP